MTSAEKEQYLTDGVALLDLRGNVWLTFDKPWYDVLGWLLWWLNPGQKALISMPASDGRVEVRAVLVATKCIRVGVAENMRQ